MAATLTAPELVPALALFAALSLGTGCGDSGNTATEASTTATTSTGSATDAPTGTPTDATTIDVAATDTSTGEPPQGTSTGDTDPTTTADSTGTTGEPVDPADALFQPASLAQFDLVLDQEAVDSLTVDSKTYVAGDLTVTIGQDVIVLTDIGVRLKGNFGSYRELDQKAAFLLNFDHYVEDQRLLDIEKLAVNNMVQDSSMQREQLGYELFRAGGVPAPRTGSAVVTVNGEPYGLYVTVEAVDNEAFLKHWYGEDKGNLYEGAYGSDVFNDLVPSFDQDNGDEVEFMDLKALATALDAITDPADFVVEVDKLIDLDNFLTFAATEIYLGHWDGYAWTRNNFFMYRRSDDLRWVFMPWGIDQTLNDQLDAFGGQGRIQQMCVASTECRVLLAQKFTEVLARVETLGLAAEAQTLADALRDAADADPRKEYGIDSVDGTVAANIQFLTNRGQSVMASLQCTDPDTVDVDKDGFSGCGQDCDDNNPAINPGAAEVCDLDDDNCDGQWDNDPKCPQCVIKKLPAPAMGNAAFCFGQRTWAEAEADCVKQKGHLIAVHSQQIQTFLVNEAFAIADTDWWLGLSDSKNEGAFVWSDATKLDYTRWAGGEPNNSGDEDCANLAPWAGGDWNDMFCDQQRPYICRLP